MSLPYYKPNELRRGDVLVAQRDITVSVYIEAITHHGREVQHQRRTIRSGDRIIYLSRRSGLRPTDYAVEVELPGGARATLDVGCYHLRRDEFKRIG